MPANDPAERRMIARIGGHERIAKYGGDAVAANARKGLEGRFERQVDPDSVLDPEERQKRAEAAKKAFYTRLQLKSAQSRRAKKAAKASNVVPFKRMSSRTA